MPDTLPTVQPGDRVVEITHQSTREVADRVVGQEGGEFTTVI